MGVASAATVVLGGCGASTTVRDPTPSAVRKPAKIGYLSPNADLSPSSIWAALAQVGWIRGSNLDVVFRFAYADTAPEMAREVIDEGVQLIMTEGEPQARAAREATDRIPIVMLSIEDALASGLVSSLARPGGNVTGVSLLGPQLAAKRVQLLH
ncbi:MAG: hypothetical protein JOY61_26520, partial [Chloroflexi bacterium]|nr:hypothetical protein [Chloroflexota bacterium]